MPWAPLSRTRLMWSWRLLGTRARAVQPASAIEANMWVAVSQSTRLCSMSTVSQAKPARARKREAVMLPRESQVPTAGLPWRRARLTGLGRINLPRSGVAAGVVAQSSSWVAGAAAGAACRPPGSRGLHHESARLDTPDLLDGDIRGPRDSPP